MGLHAEQIKYRMAFPAKHQIDKLHFAFLYHDIPGVAVTMDKGVCIRNAFKDGIDPLRILF